VADRDKTDQFHGSIERAECTAVDDRKPETQLKTLVSPPGRCAVRHGSRDRHEAVRSSWNGWLYLAVVVDVFARAVVDWAMADQLRAKLRVVAPACSGRSAAGVRPITPAVDSNVSTGYPAHCSARPYEFVRPLTPAECWPPTKDPGPSWGAPWQPR
jgi:hypothetical protein